MLNANKSALLEVARQLSDLAREAGVPPHLKFLALIRDKLVTEHGFSESVAEIIVLNTNFPSSALNKLDETDLGELATIAAININILSDQLTDSGFKFMPEHIAVYVGKQFGPQGL